MLCGLFAVVVLVTEIAALLGFGERLGTYVLLPRPVAANVSIIIGILVGLSRRTPISGAAVGLLMLLIFDRAWPLPPLWNSVATVVLSLFLMTFEGKRAYDRLLVKATERTGSASSSTNSGMATEDDIHSQPPWRRWLDAGASDVRSWFHARHPTALLFTGLLSPIVFVADLLGWEGKMRGWGSMRSISEIWWHLPVLFVVLYVLALLTLGARTGR